MTNYEQLPSNLQSILSFIEAYIANRGYAPSVREICAAVDTPSTSTIHGRLRQLEEAGMLRRDPSRPRAMVVQKSPSENKPGDNTLGDTFQGLTGQSEQPFSQADHQTLRCLPFADIPDALSGEGTKNPGAIQTWLLPQGLLKNSDYFVTVMPDDSMINRQLSAGDHLIIRRQVTADNNDIIIGLLDGEVLIRTYTKGLRQVRLQVEGDDFVVVSIDPEDLTIYGVVAGLLHSLG
ncbi:MAG: hypothetical protein FWG28_00220 [Clostridiales bacterium]|nr:hypothetical protein [Clostridiales bacterium]